MHSNDCINIPQKLLPTPPVSLLHLPTSTLLLPCFICDLKEPEGQGMGWVEAVLVLVVLQSVTTSLPHWADAGDLLSPLISTYSHVFKISDEICNNSVECGKGSCQVSTDDSLGFVCKCNPGWSQFHIGDYFRFLPCIIPNCSINYSCSNGTLAPAASPSPHPTNVSKLDPCSYSYCGAGTCVSRSTFGYRCECREGFSNLLNMTIFPCYRDCSLGGDCANLGITLSNSSSSSPPSLSDNGSSSSDTIGPKNLLMVMLVIGLIFVRTR
ncbi:EGF [Musa troglodytarum]|uniref:EGF n=1 Tax=Musa troglodytarum TaxID=320322 RepID=A0A9E7GLY1_9LILI|nr:EGF [Musa troglodytarum]